MNAELRSKFLTNTDETGRFIVFSQRTGKSYFVEPIVTSNTPEWGSIDPATGKLTHKKGDGKYRGGVSPNESLITAGVFDKIHMLDKGTSPHHAIDVLDAKYPDLVQ